MKKLTLYLIIIFFITTSFAQENITGTISGKVIDSETQQPLSFANVWIEGTTTGCSTDDNGNFKINYVVVGRYTVSVKMLGYEQNTISEIIVVSKRSTIVNFDMKPTVTQMAEIVVRPDYFTKPSDKSINSITSIDLQEIKRTPGAPDVFRRLQSVAGVSKTGDNSPQLIVRGGAPDENLTIIENIDVYSPFHFSSLGGGMAEGVSIIQPKVINNVSFLTGGFSTKYGDKLSSVTDIQLQQPATNRVNTDLTVDLSGFSAIISGPLSSKASWLICGRRGIYDLMMKIRGKEYYPKTIDLHSKFIFEPDKKHKFTFYGLFVQDDLERIKDDDEIGTAEQLKYRNIIKNMSAFGVTWKYLFSQNGFLQITPYFNLNKWKMTESRQENTEDTGYENQEDFFAIKGFTSYRFAAKHRIIAGFEYKNIKTDYTQWTTGDTLRNGIIVPAFNRQFGPENSYKSAGFIQYIFTPNDKLQINPGGRADYFKFTNDLVFSPRISVNYQLTKKININASSGLFTQYPPFYKIFLDDQNTNLKTNKSIHYIIGTDYLLTPEMQLKIEGFYKDIYDIAVTETDTSKLYRSSGTGTVTGLEITLTQKMSKNLYLLANYTYCKSKRKDNENSEIYDFDYDSPHISNLMTTYKLGNWWDFSIICRYATGLPYTPYDLNTRRQIDGIWYADKEGKNSARLPDYFRTDLRVDRRFVFRNYNIGAYLEIWNLTNHQNVLSYEYSSDFTEKEPVILFPMMPMIGLTIEF